MQIFHSLDELGNQPSVVTIGNFDGVHRGHRMVIDTVTARAREIGARSVAITFDPHPMRVLKPDAETRLDATLVLPFTREFANWTARDFATRVLRDALHSIEVHEGETFRFGHNAEAGIDGLAQLGQELGFGVRTYQPWMQRGAPVSSSRVRSLISD